MRIRWSRGLWRLWLVASLIWGGCFAVFYGTAYSALKNEVKPSVGYFDDLIPKYKPCWDYRTDDGKNIDIKKLSDEALVRIYECQLEADRTALLKAAAATTIGVPLLALIFGWLLLWIGRGFSQNAPG
jgi:hypothetical protein